jgi:hypothetical protein
MAHSTVEIISSSQIKCKNLQQAMSMFPACFELNFIGRVTSLHTTKTGIRGEFSVIHLGESIVDFEYSSIESDRLVQLSQALIELQISGEGLHITADFYLVLNERMLLIEPSLLKLGSPFSAIANYFTIFDNYMSALNINRARNKYITIAQITNYLWDVSKNSLCGNIILFSGGTIFQRKFHINSSALNVKAIFLPMLISLREHAQSLLLLSESIQLNQDINLAEMEVYSVLNDFESLCGYFSYGNSQEPLDTAPKKINFKDRIYE